MRSTRDADSAAELGHFHDDNSRTSSAVASEYLGNVLDQDASGTVDPVRSDEHVDASETDHGFSAHLLIRLLRRGRSETHKTCHALPQTGFRRRWVICRDIRTMGKCCAFSSRRGK
jgi:hypothetical protein